MMYHEPVLLKECIEGLNIKPNGVYVDVTFGSGGHSEEIAQFLDQGRLIAFDRDPDAAVNLKAETRIELITQNYRYLKNFLGFSGIRKIDGLLADLGISSWQIDNPDRGFSTRFDGALDMRMDKTGGLTAAEVVNMYPAERLIEIFQTYGEIHNPRRLVLEIERARSLEPVMTTGDLRIIASACAARGKENQYLAQVFQAIRIEVNEELDSLREMLIQAVDLLNTGGRIVIISYHSLEDRMVKNFFRSGNFEGREEKDFFGRSLSPLRPVSRKAIRPAEEELSRNPRSRSARLRIAEKNQNAG
jgi:16S rRNA (cytosine1402-N4)-methyltransferase